jgi:hypothetical protein
MSIGFHGQGYCTDGKSRGRLTISEEAPVPVTEACACRNGWFRVCSVVANCGLLWILSIHPAETIHVQPNNRFLGIGLHPAVCHPCSQPAMFTAAGRVSMYVPTRGVEWLSEFHNTTCNNCQQWGAKKTGYYKLLAR